MSTASAQARTAKSQATAAAKVTPAPKGLVQRQCACGGKAGVNGECEECRKKRLSVQRKTTNQQQAAASTNPTTAPPIVSEVVGSPGRPLEPEIRTEMEARFGHDFSRTRIHTDARAAASARAVAARAYVVGGHVVFGQGEYSPSTHGGRRLLIHELVHTLQQGGETSTDTGRADLEIGPCDDHLEREATLLAERPLPRISHGASIRPRLQRAPFEGLPGQSLRPQNPPDVFPDRGETLPFREATELARCLEFFGEGQEPSTCVPNRNLTWNDFTGTPPGRPQHDANTRPDLRKVSFTVGSAECRNIVLGEPLEGQHKIQAFLDGSRTWVLPRWRNAADPAQNTCNQKVADCEAFFDREAAAGRQGGTRGLGIRPRCPATVRPDPTALAHDRGECSTVLLSACNDREVAESARLLRHEQLHFDIGCVLAKKANQMLAAGGDADAILRGAKALLQPLHNQYDRATGHGCQTGPQADWEQRIARELPTVDIRPQARRRRRRRRGRRRRRR